MPFTEFEQMPVKPEAQHSVSLGGHSVKQDVKTATAALVFLLSVAAIVIAVIVGLGRLLALNPGI